MIGANYVGNVAISEQYTTNTDTLVMRKGVNSWYELVDSIKNRGTLSAVQLGCRYYPNDARKSWRLSDQHILIKNYREFISSLKDDEISKIMNRFVSAAEIAVSYGFDIVQIHAAHGYFLSLLLNRFINVRAGSYSYENLGGIRELIFDIKNISKNIILDMRLSCGDGIGNSLTLGEEWRDRFHQVKALSECGLDMVSLSAGAYDFSKLLIYPSVRGPRGAYLKFAEELAKSLNCHVNVAGNFVDLDSIESNSLDNISYCIGRPLIADPEFVSKMLLDNKGRVVQCTGAGYCHYYTRGKRNISCKVNPNI